ncbi:MAG: ATP-binding protein, partial [Acidobacteriota bacterium]
EREEIEPYHDRGREVVADGLGEEKLRRLHRHLAETLEASGRADPETLAMHFQATEDERAHAYAVSAARRAERALAFTRAARLYRLALDLMPPPPEQRPQSPESPAAGADRYALKVSLGEALGNAGRSRDAAETFLDAVGSGTIADPFEAQRSAAEKLLISGHIDRGLAVLGHVLRTAGMEFQRRPWRSLLHLWWLRLRLRMRGFDFTEREEKDLPQAALRRIDVCWSAEVGLCLVDALHASEFHARHLLLALEAGEPQRVARGLALEVFFGAMEGESGRPVLERARNLAGRVEGRYAASLTEMAAGMLACNKGEWRDARRRLTRAEMYLQENRRGVTWELDTVRQFRALAELSLGRWQDLFRRLPTMLEVAREQEDLY